MGFETWKSSLLLISLLTGCVNAATLPAGGDDQAATEPPPVEISRPIAGVTVETVAGSGPLGIDRGDLLDGQASAARFWNPIAVCIGEGGGLLVSDYFNHRIRRLSRDGLVQTVVGKGLSGLGRSTVNPDTLEVVVESPEARRDGALSDATIPDPRGIVASGSVTYVFDGYTVRRLDSQGLTTLAGGAQGYADGKGTDAKLERTISPALDAAGNLIFADGFNHRIRKMTPDGTVLTLAGGGATGTEGGGYVNGPADQARFAEPTGVAFGPNGDLYIADSRNDCIRVLRPDGQVETFAGHPAPAASNTVSVREQMGEGLVDARGTEARFYFPLGIAVDPNGNVLVTDSGNHRVRLIQPDGEVYTLAGSGPSGTGNGEWADGPGTSARFNQPMGLAVDASGAIYVADMYNHRIRRISRAK